MSRIESPNQMRPLPGSIPAVRPRRSETSCWLRYSCQICFARDESESVHSARDITQSSNRGWCEIRRFILRLMRYVVTTDPTTLYDPQQSPLPGQPRLENPDRLCRPRQYRRFGIGVLTTKGTRFTKGLDSSRPRTEDGDQLTIKNLARQGRKQRRKKVCTTKTRRARSSEFNGARTFLSAYCRGLENPRSFEEVFTRAAQTFNYGTSKGRG